MKKVIRCGECANRMYDLGIGFVPHTTMLCGVIGCEVEDDDGCTFGMIGEGGYVSKKYDVDISGYAAVNGRHEYEEW